MQKVDNLRLLIVGAGAGSNFIASRLIDGQTDDAKESDLNNEYRANREYGGIRNTVKNEVKHMSGEVFDFKENERYQILIDGILKSKFPTALELSRKVKKPKLLSSIINVINLMSRWDGEKFLDKPQAGYITLTNRIKRQWRYNLFWRQPHFWFEKIEMYMANFEKWTRENKHKSNMSILLTDDYKRTKEFISKWNILAWEVHKIENQPLTSIEHYLPLFMDKNVTKELSKLVNICVVHVDDNTTGFVTDILNMKHMTETIREQTNSVKVMGPNYEELEYADVVVSYRKLFYDASPTEIRKLFKFVGREEYFDNNKEKEIKAFHDYHMSNVNYYVDNWEELSEEIV